MDHPGFVGEGHRPGHVARDAHHVLLGEGGVLVELGGQGAPQLRHREVDRLPVLSHVEDADDVRVPQLARDRRLVEKARGELAIAGVLGLEQLQGDVGAAVAVGGGEHPCHPAPSQQGGDGVRTDGLADQGVGLECQTGPLEIGYDGG
jgi:hypothetical protein